MSHLKTTDDQKTTKTNRSGNKWEQELKEDQKDNLKDVRVRGLKKLYHERVELEKFVEKSKTHAGCEAHRKISIRLLSVLTMTFFMLFMFLSSSTELKS